MPVACLSIFLTSRLVQDPPNLQAEVQKLKRTGLKLDTVGFGFIALAFGCLEVLLDKGQQDDWFNSTFIQCFFALTIIGFVGMIAWELHVARRGEMPILDLALFKNSNFALSFLMMILVGFALFGTNVVLPQVLQNLLGYTAGTAGKALSSGGIATLIMLPVVGFLSGKVDPRKLVFAGFVLVGLGLFFLAHLNLAISFGWAAEARFYQSLGIGFLFVPISTLSYVGTRPDQSNNVSGITNLGRNVGGSLGTSFVTTYVARWGQKHQAYLARHVNPGNANWDQRLTLLTSQAWSVLPSHFDAQHRALAQFYQRTLLPQSNVLAYKDVIHFLAFSMLMMAPLAFFMSRPAKTANAAAL